MIKVFCYTCKTQREIKTSLLTSSHQDFAAWCPTCETDTMHHRVHVPTSPT